MNHTTHSHGRMSTYTALQAVLLGCLVALLVLAGATSRDTQAQSAPRWDAQSTTGPAPPPEVNVAGTHLPSPDAVVLSDVPAYIWRHGCGPTAAGMVIGYWDGHGFGALVPGDAMTQTLAVDVMMASDGNYNDYCLPLDFYPDLLPDRSEPPPGDEHPDDCLADYMKASQSASYNYYGWSWFSDVTPSLLGYVNSLGLPDYRVTAGDLYMQFPPYLTWSSFQAEINSGRPLVFLVDTDGNGGTDHFVPAIGYDTVGGVNYYACLNTWDQDIHWFVFAQMTSGQPWGIYGATWFHISQADYVIYLPLIFN